MDQFNPISEIRPSILATDLDGTLIPLDGNAANQADLKTLDDWLSEHDCSLIFVTGRPFPSVQSVMQSAALPIPQWILCDVGTSIYQAQSGNHYQPVVAYSQHLDTIVADAPRAIVEEALRQHQSIELQSADNQRPHKISYQCDVRNMEAAMDALIADLKNNFPAWQAMASVDPFDGRGLIDILPAGASKAHGILWLAEYAQLDPSAIVYAGDSGNDLAALTAGFRAIVVSNADESVKTAVTQALAARKLTHRLHLAKNPATSGVLEGLKVFSDKS